MKRLVIALLLASQVLAQSPLTQADIPSWWNAHIRGYRPDRSRRWDSSGGANDLAGLVELVKRQQLEQDKRSVIAPIESRMPTAPIEPTVEPFKPLQRIDYTQQGEPVR